MTDLEHQVLSEYARLAHNIRQLSTRIKSSDDHIDQLRALERKMGLVLTLVRQYQSKESILTQS